MFKRLWLPGLLLMVGLAACGETSGRAQQTPSLPPTTIPAVTDAAPGELLVSELPAPSNGGLILPELVGIQGGLIIARGQNLWLAWFGGEEPVLLAHGIVPAMIEPSPDGRAVVYARGVNDDNGADPGGLADGFEYRLTITELETLNSADVITVGNRRRTYAMLLGWSPDSQTVLAWNSSALIASSADGLTIQAVAGQPSVGWLPDSAALIIAPENLMTPGAPLGVYRVDPRTGIRSTDVRVPLDGSLDFLHLAGALAARGILLDPTFHDFHRAAPLMDGGWAFIEWPDAVKQMDAPLCATWELRRTQPDVTLYSSPNTTFLSDLTVLPDGSLLFLRWMLNQCHFRGGMTVELVRLLPSQEPVIITRDVDPGSQGDPSLVKRMGYWLSRKYAVTGDGRFIFWIGKGDMESVSLVHVTDLQAGFTAALLADVVMADGAGQFEGVYWVPRPLDEEEGK